MDSHESVTETSYDALRGRYPHADEAALRLSMRLSTEVMYAATEMVIDNPQLDGNLINAEVADMVVRYYDKFVENEEAYAGTLKKRAAPKKQATKKTVAARKTRQR